MSKKSKKTNSKKHKLNNQTIKKELETKQQTITKQLETNKKELETKQQISDKQLEANRLNAEKSEGPLSEAGKEISSRNAISHGAYTGNTLIKGESQKEFDAFYQGLYKCFNPKDELYAIYVDDYIWASWKARRFRIYEARVLNEKSSNAIESIKEIDRLTRIEQRIERNRERALKKIEAYKKQLAAEELHKKMEGNMHWREVKGSNGKKVILPSAEEMSAEIIIQSSPSQGDKMGSFCQTSEIAPNQPPLSDKNGVPSSV